MAAPEYFIKLKFGTELDKKAFSDIQETFNKLNTKQQQMFAKQYGSSVEDMRKLFSKQMNSGLREYEKASIKTEKTLTTARIRELRDYITRRNAQLKRLPKATLGTLGAAGVDVARAYVNASTSLTSFEKNTITSTGGRALGYGTAGFIAGGPIGAALGAGIGAVTGFVLSELENEGDAIRRSVDLFNSAVNTYVSTINEGKRLGINAVGKGFTSAGEYAVFEQAMKLVGIENTDFIYDLVRSLAANEPTAALGKQLLGERADTILQTLYSMWQKSGKSAEEFVLGTGKGDGLGINQSDARAKYLINAFEAGGIQALVNQVMAGSGKAKGWKATGLDTAIAEATAKANDLSIKEFWNNMEHLVDTQDINMNTDIMNERDRSFKRSLTLMKESNILLAGINEQYKTYQKELSQIFSYITKRTGVGTVAGETMKAKATRALKTGDVTELVGALTGSNPLPHSPVPDMQSKVESATNRSNMTRIQNKQTPIGAY